MQKYGKVITFIAFIHKKCRMNRNPEARKMLVSGEPVDLRVWKSDGSIIEYNNCIPLRYDFYKGT